MSLWLVVLIVGGLIFIALLDVGVEAVRESIYDATRRRESDRD